MTPAARDAPISQPNFTANFMAKWTDAKKIKIILCQGDTQE